MSTQDLITDKVTISWQEKKNRRFLSFLFNGNFTESEAQSAAEIWDSEFLSVPANGKVDLIWNCLEMKKYSAGAAKIWKKEMFKQNPKIDTIWLVTSNTFIKMGARTVTFLFPINLKVVGSEQEIV